MPPLWVIVDGVNCRDASQCVGEYGAAAACLYTTTDPGTAVLSPWLVRVRPGDPELGWLQSLPHDQNWGVLLQSYASLGQSRAHFRKFTMLWTPANDQAPVYFRFYDPRVAVVLAQALEPWKLTRLMMLVKRLIAPLSPLMSLPAALNLTEQETLTTTADDSWRRLISITANQNESRNVGRGQAIAIGEAEYERFSALQRTKANRKMARSFVEVYPE